MVAREGNGRKEVEGGEVRWDWRGGLVGVEGFDKCIEDMHWVDGHGWRAEAEGCNWCRVGRLVEIQEGRVKGGSGNMETIKGWNYERGGGAVLWK